MAGYFCSEPMLLTSSMFLGGNLHTLFCPRILASSWNAHLLVPASATVRAAWFDRWNFQTDVGDPFYRAQPSHKALAHLHQCSYFQVHLSFFVKCEDFLKSFFVMQFPILFMPLWRPGPSTYYHYLQLRTSLSIAQLAIYSNPHHVSSNVFFYFNFHCQFHTFVHRTVVASPWFLIHSPSLHHQCLSSWWLYLLLSWLLLCLLASLLVSRQGLIA